MFRSMAYILMGLVAMIFAACGAIDENQVLGDGREHRIAFTLSLSKSGTRTTWGSDDYTKESGDDFENKIDMQSLRVVVHNADNSIVGEVKDLYTWVDGGTTTRIVGDISHLTLTAGGVYKIMVYANCPEGNAADNPNFEYTVVSDGLGAIPMWGVEQVTLDLSAQQDIGDIELLRAMAKVEVVLSDEMADYKLSGVSANVINRYGYCLPSGWGSVASTAELVRDNSMNEYRSMRQPSGGVLFRKVSDRKYILYIPEYMNTDPLTPPTTLSVALTDSSDNLLTFADALQFGQYSGGRFVEGSMYNIVRNTIYRYNIVGLAGGLMIDYTVADWEFDDENTWDYGSLAYPTYHNPVLPDDIYADGTNIPKDPQILTEPTMVYNNGDNEAGAFSIWFYMSGPVGQIWTPTFDASTSNYECVVYKNGVKLTDENQYIADPTAWYNIKVYPKNNEGAGNTIDFGITYKASWMHEGTDLYLFINGKADAIAWPNSGTDPKIIKIRHIE